MLHDVCLSTSITLIYVLNYTPNVLRVDNYNELACATLGNISFAFLIALVMSSLECYQNQNHYQERH